MSHPRQPTTRIAMRAQCYVAIGSEAPHANVRVIQPWDLAPLSNARRSLTNNRRRCEMNIQTVQQAKTSSALPRSQTFLTESSAIDDGVARGFIRYTVNAYVPKSGVNHQLVSVIQGGLAMEIIEILATELVHAKFSITRYAREMEDFDDDARSNSRIKDLVIWLRDSQEPGKDFLTLIGFWDEIGHQTDIRMPIRPH